MGKWLRTVLIAGAALGLGAASTGCVSARMSDHETDRMFRRGEYDLAADRLKRGLASQGEAGVDSLLYYLDIGLSLHSAGKFEESNKYFLKADKIAEIKDYTSLAAEASTLLVSDNTKDYKGEDFEKVLINSYLAMNYALMGDAENALVEARRVNHKLYMMITDGKRKYKQSAFARYLSAMLYESQGNFNDAYVDYKNTHDLFPSFPGLGRDLWRMAYAQHDRDDMDHWDQEYGLTEEDHAAARQLVGRKRKGEIIILYENGLSPIKRPNPNFYSIPKFYPRYNPVALAQVKVDGKYQGDTKILDDIQAIAMNNLTEKYAGIIAKKVAGVVAKELIGDAVGHYAGSRAIGQLAKFAMYAADQADLRSWSLLPRDLQIARITVDPGTYQVEVDPSGANALPAKTIQVGRGQKIFVNFRYMP